jgi:dTDP-glucose 4,6-dehydratase
MEISRHVDLKDSAVTVLTRNPDNFVNSYPEFSDEKWLKICRGDILESLEKLSNNGQSYTHVLHAAADSTLGPKMGALERFDQIVVGTRNILDFAVKVKAKRFLLTSSGGVYGALPSNIDSFSESFMGMANPLESSNAYSVAKRLAEHLCSLYAEKYDLEVVVARCFAFVGPDLPLDVHFAIGNFISNSLRNVPIEIKGDGTPRRSYLYAADLMIWLWTILFRGTSCRPYNVGSENSVSIKEVAQIVASTCNPPLSPNVLGTPKTGEVPSCYVPSTQRARAELGLEERVTLVDAIAKTQDWARNSSYRI